MGKDTSMNGRTAERIDERAREHVEQGRNDPTYSWWPGHDQVGTEARRIYDESHKFYSGKKDK
jgi:hypothetical protein